MKRTTIASNMIVGLFLFLLSSCYAPPTDQNMGDEKVEKLSCLLVFPAAAMVDSSDKMQQKQAKELQDGAVFMNSALAGILGGNERVVMVDDAMLNQYHPTVEGGRFGAVKAVSQDLGCDTVLLTTVSRFKQRQGGEMAVDAPASVAFELKMLDTKEGRVIWSGAFSETQEALLQNLFSMKKAEKRGLKWITAEELADQGLRERLKSCPYL